MSHTKKCFPQQLIAKMFIKNIHQNNEQTFFCHWISLEQIQPSFPSLSPSKFFQASSRIALVYQSVCSRTIADRLYSDWIVEKNLGGSLPIGQSFTLDQSENSLLHTTMSNYNTMHVFWLSFCQNTDMVINQVQLE